MRIFHLTSVHPRIDTRIFYRQCISLAKKYTVHLIVCDGKGNEIKDNISIIDLGKPKNRLSRILISPIKILLYCLKNNADIYHFHDPELMFVGSFLKLFNKTIIYDAHEDFPQQVFLKHYLPNYISIIISKLAQLAMFCTMRFFNQLITVTPHIEKKLIKLNSNINIIHNYPNINEFPPTATNKKGHNVCYIGMISFPRGLKEISLAIQSTSGHLFIGGKPASNKESNFLQQQNKNKVTYLGFLNRQNIQHTFSKSVAGLMLAHPMDNMLHSFPVKLFEYMSAGLPVIISNFPIWKAIIDKHQCGICVDPTNIDEISDAIQWVFDHPEKALAMGKRGQHATKTVYNWDIEESKLFSIYSKIK
jgi:glycosyltransferase involved in cell wall biosynthesis